MHEELFTKAVIENAKYFYDKYNEGVPQQFNIQYDRVNGWHAEFISSMSCRKDYTIWIAGDKAKLIYETLDEKLVFDDGLTWDSDDDTSKSILNLTEEEQEKFADIFYSEYVDFDDTESPHPWGCPWLWINPREDRCSKTVEDLVYSFFQDVKDDIQEELEEERRRKENLDDEPYIKIT